MGDTGEGKTVVAYAIAEQLNKDGVFIYHLDRYKALPKWMHNLPSNRAIELKEPNSALVIDDAHNYFYAGQEDDREDLKAIDMINRARRHGGKRSVIYTTQQSTVLSRKLIGMTTFLIFKKSSPIQIQFERPEFQKMFLEANQALENQPINIAYVIGSSYKGVVDVDLPRWYNAEISESKEAFQRNNQHTTNPIFGAIAKIGEIFG